MFTDNDLVLAEKQAVTNTAKSTKSFDQEVKNQLGIGNPLYLIIQVTKAFTAGAGDVNLKSHSAEPGAAGTEGNVLATAPFSAAELTVVGTRKELVIPASPEAERYIFAQFEMATAGASGEFTAWITNKTEGYQYIPSGYTVA